MQRGVGEFAIEKPFGTEARQKITTLPGTSLIQDCDSVKPLWLQDNVVDDGKACPGGDALSAERLPWSCMKIIPVLQAVRFARDG